MPRWPARDDPRDPALPFLDAALDPVAATVRLNQALSEYTDGSPIQVQAARLLRHKPGRRALIQYRLAPHPRLPELVLGKTRARGLDWRTWRLARELDEIGLACRGPYRAGPPRPLGTVPDWHLWLQAWAPGATLWNGLLGPDPAGRAAGLAAGVAEALQALHRAPIDPERAHGSDEELAILDQRLGLAAGTHPPWARRLRRLLAACRELAEGVRGRGGATLHRDFYPDQMLVAENRLYLLDLDLCARGDPALDVGNFIAHLDEHALRHPAALRQAQRSRRAFVERYLELDPDPGLPTAIEIQATLTLARHIQISTLFPDRAPFTESLLVRCEQRLRLAPGLIR